MMTKEDIKKVWLTKDAVYIQSNDGKIAKENFADYPPLKDADEEQLKNFRLSVYGIHWDDLDEDLSFEGFFKEEIETA